MNAALGSAGIILGFVASLGGIATLGVGLTRRRTRLLVAGRTYVWMVAVGALLAFVAMERALLTHDFSIAFVANNSSRHTPFPFNVATLWSALEGSIILWTTILAGFIVVVALKFRSRSIDPLVGWATLTMFTVSLFFFGLMLPNIGPADPFTGTPFTIPPGFDGPGPNALLQNHVLMAFHPPLLYLGYVGFTVPFAFAIAALVTA